MSQTITAQIGTAMYLGTPNSPMLPAMPINSPTTLPKLVMRMPSIMRNVIRRPYSSRIRSLKPLPVTAPMRAHISCTTIRAMVVGIIVHNSM